MPTKSAPPGTHPVAVKREDSPAAHSKLLLGYRRLLGRRAKQPSGPPSWAGLLRRDAEPAAHTRNPTAGPGVSPDSHPRRPRAPLKIAAVPPEEEFSYSQETFRFSVRPSHQKSRRLPVCEGLPALLPGRRVHAGFPFTKDVRHYRKTILKDISAYLPFCAVSRYKTSILSSVG